MGCQGIRESLRETIQIAIFADLHLHERPASSSPGIRQNFHIEAQADAMRELCHHAKKRGIHLCAFLGDFFHTRDALSILEARVAKEVLQRLNDTFEETLFICGNHDFGFLLDGQTYLSTLTATMPRIRLIREAQLVHFQSHPTFAISCLPHCADMEGALQRLVAAASQCRLSITDRSDPPLLLGHAKTVGGILDTGAPSKSGLTAAMQALIRDTWHTCWLGDFHTPQELMGGKIRYVGAASQRGPQDAGLEPCWCALVFSRNENAHWQLQSFERVALRDAPRYCAPDQAQSKRGPRLNAHPVIQTAKFGREMIEAAANRLGIPVTEELVGDALTIQSSANAERDPVMDRLCFERIEARNFRSYETLDFRLDTPGVTLISGPCGSGKSTIFHALHYALFGTGANGETAKELLRRGAPSMDVALTLRLGDTQYVIRRGHGPGAPCQLICAGKAAEYDGVRALQDAIHALLRMSPALFRMAAFFGRQHIGAFTRAQAGEQKEAMLELFGPPWLEDALRHADGLCEAASATYHTAAADLAKLDREEAYWTGRLDLARTAFRAMTATESSEVFDLSVSKADLEAALAKARTDQLRAASESQRLQAVIRRAKEDAARFRADAARMPDRSGGYVCYACHQPVQKAAGYAMTQDLTRKAEMAEKAAKDASAALSRLPASTFTDEETARIERTLRFLNWKETEQMVADAAARLEEARSRCALARAALGGLADRYDYLSKHLKALFGSNGVRVEMILAGLKNVEIVANEALRAMMGLSLRLDVAATAARSRLDTRLCLENGVELPYSSGSDGQRAAIDLALAWAVFTLTPRPVALTVADEPFDALDPKAAGKALEWLDSNFQDTSVIIITHRADVIAAHSGARYVAIHENLTSRLVSA